MEVDYVQNHAARHHNRCIDLEHDAARIAGTVKPHIFHSINGHRVAVNPLSLRVALFTALRIRREDMARHLASVEPNGDIRLVADPPTKEIRSKPDLSKLPIFTYFKNDPPLYITALEFDPHFDAGGIERGLAGRGFDTKWFGSRDRTLIGSAVQRGSSIRFSK